MWALHRSSVHIHQEAEMAGKTRISKYLLVIVITLILSLSVGTFALAQGGGGLKPPTVLEPQPEIPAAPQAALPESPADYTIDSWEFTAYDSTASPLQKPMWLITMLYNGGTQSGNYMAPVHIPDGVTVSKLVVYYHDEGDLPIFAYMMRCSLMQLGCSALSSSPLPDSGSFIASFEIPLNHVIDLKNYTYHVEVLLPQGTNYGINGARINYGNTVSLPAVLR
jgi:hypothetical protein